MSDEHYDFDRNQTVLLELIKTKSSKLKWEAQTDQSYKAKLDNDLYLAIERDAWSKPEESLRLMLCDKDNTELVSWAGVPQLQTIYHAALAQDEEVMSKLEKALETLNNL